MIGYNFNKKENEEKKNNITKNKKFQEGKPILSYLGLKNLDTKFKVLLHFPDPTNQLHFIYTCTPEEGYWKNLTHQFEFIFPLDYPNKPPKVKCLTKIFHPNIDETCVDLNLLLDYFNNRVTLESYLFGILFLFIEPNFDDPQNSQASKEYKKDKNQFIALVQDYHYKM